MTVSELIEALQTLPPGASVAYLWDGAARTDVRHVYRAVSGNVVLAGAEGVIYDQSDWPVSAALGEQQYGHWYLPE
jgi:hypothetical protein